MTKAMDPRWRKVSWQQALSQATPAIARLLEEVAGRPRTEFRRGGLAACDRQGSDLLALVKVATRRDGEKSAIALPMW